MLQISDAIGSYSLKAHKNNSTATMQEVWTF